MLNENADFVIDGGSLDKYCGNGGSVVIPSGVREIGCAVFE